jgi:hypothetical protein
LPIDLNGMHFVRFNESKRNPLESNFSTSLLLIIELGIYLFQFIMNVVRKRFGSVLVNHLNKFKCSFLIEIRDNCPIVLGIFTLLVQVNLGRIRAPGL